MRSGAILFRFQVEPVLREAVRNSNGTLSAIPLSLPFVTIFVRPTTLESSVAAEIILHARDRRVLSHQECCDGCIDDALASLQDLRAKLVGQQLRLVNESGALSNLIDLMLTAIRQFLTFEQRLSASSPAKGNGRNEWYRDASIQSEYFDALEMLRGHLSRCLGQVAAVAGMTLPNGGLVAGYQGPWPLDAYVPADPATFAT